MNAWHMPTRKTEQAFAALLRAMGDPDLVAQVRIYTRFSGMTLAEHYAQIVCEEADTFDQEYGITGQWRVRGKIVVRSHYAKEGDGTDDTANAGARHDAYVGMVMDLLRLAYDYASDDKRSAVPRNLNECAADADFTALENGFVLDGIRERIDGHSYETEIAFTLRMICSK